MKATLVRFDVQENVVLSSKSDFGINYQTSAVQMQKHIFCCFFFLAPAPALAHLREGVGAPLSSSQCSHEFLGKQVFFTKLAK